MMATALVLMMAQLKHVAIDLSNTRDESEDHDGLQMRLFHATAKYRSSHNQSQQQRSNYLGVLMLCPSQR